MKEKMLDKVIRRFGFEDERTISFAWWCEQNISIEGLEKIFDYIMEKG